MDDLAEAGAVHAREGGDFALVFTALDAGDLKSRVPCHAGTIGLRYIGVKDIMCSTQNRLQPYTAAGFMEISNLAMLQGVGLGATIRARRKPLMTQGEFAKRLGLSQPSVSDWERDESLPPSDLLPHIALLLGCTVEDLVSGIDTRYDESRRQFDPDQQPHDLTHSVTPPGVSSANPTHAVAGGNLGTATSRRPSGPEWTVKEMLARTEIIEHAEHIIRLSKSLHAATRGSRPTGSRPTGSTTGHSEVRHGSPRAKRGARR